MLVEDRAIVPEPGMPATYHIVSCSYGYTVKSVSASGLTVVLSRNGGGADVKATKRKDGRYRPAGAQYGGFSFGKAVDYIPREL